MGDVLNGQWMGPYEGSNHGLIILNLDDLGDHYAGISYLSDANVQLPSTAAYIRTSNKDPVFSFRTSQLFPVDPQTGQAVDWKSVENKYPGIRFSSHADVKGSLKGQTLAIEWETDIGTTGKAELRKIDSSTPSQRVSVPSVTDWKTFKQYIDGLPRRRFIFRGQSEQWRLRTTYHRTGRADLSRYRYNDIPTLLRHLSARTKHFFRLEIPDENGAFYSLIQHHGYPTPLLDWTFSPYVAAFFAFRGVSRNGAPSSPTKVRIFCFDQEAWRSHVQPLLWLDTASPHFTILESLPIENDRMIPQQAISTVTNIDDIESFIAQRERQLDRTFLQVIDIPASQREQAMRDLGLMGVTAGSLLPGLDGACEELRERFFST